MTRKWIIDVSHYNPLTDTQWKILIDNGLAGAIFRAGGSRIDPYVYQHVEMAVKYDVLFGLYYWSDPIFSRIDQLNELERLITDLGPQFICGDYEHYWKSWQQWWDIIINHQPGTVEIFTHAQLDRYYTKYLIAMKQLAAKYAMPVAGYSANWFINGYCKTLGYRIEEHTDVNFLAEYITWRDPNEDQRCSWNEFNIFLESIPPPKLPKGMTSWGIHQYRAGLPIEGLPPLDFDYITDEAFEFLYHGHVIPTPIPEPEPDPITVTSPHQRWEVITEYVNVRSEPVVKPSTDIGNAYKGDILEQKDIAGSGAWLKTTDGNYVAIKYRGKRYLSPVD